MKMIVKGMSSKEAVEAVRRLLVRTGRETLLPKIGRAFERIAHRERSKSEVVLTIARAADQRAAEKESSAALSNMKLSAKDVVTQIDESLIGGWRIEGREHLVDASFKKYLLSLYNRATQS